ncbi:SsgA family sporulation/cell division regulator [Amycolatopsis acidiphila]|uniref:SsgA family sporulation/cell division regulator n=1 Tax=Amycolatopsis acidiphila TaxID=715473 RepID=A0A558A3S0_9PSEU|nr:SsgA family sporulation/cell division regulator [Amycolatopsis acidiphila]TVT18903.1 SsgA family sporulation/cell division regulator [Amycolatopsis acidiphila]UIJ60601.1 SsgA family sporulation/cell division regulator [Amycolatopsis acidiphila]GHG81855.1 sporulation protein SsgA [Amycolatopsis acidiphila]
MLPLNLNLTMWAEWEDTSGEVIELRPVQVKFRYRSDDPFAVLLDFAVGAEQWVRWEIARDLLAAGLMRDSGDGDVYVAPDSDLPWRVWLTVSSPTGVALFAFHRPDLESALAQTEMLVPSGSESAQIDWNRELHLLGGEAA